MNDQSLPERELAPWKVLIADDDRDVHVATRMALRGASFRGRKLSFLSAYSGEEALAVLQENQDIAVVLLDVVMETDSAGLGTVQRIRESGLKLVRIIIRTGYPGQAPENAVILDYDIHDYKEKTGLTVQKLLTSMISALRAYDDLSELENHRRGLMSVLESVSWFDFNAVRSYVCGMLAEFVDLSRIGAGRIVMVARPSDASKVAPTLVASLGNWLETGELSTFDDMPAQVAGLIRDSLDGRAGLDGPSGTSLFVSDHGVDLVVFADGDSAFDKADEILLQVFLIKVCQAVSNHRTFSEMEQDRDAVLRGLALRAESWNPNAAVELTRLANLVTEIANRLDMMMFFPFEIDSHFLRHIAIATTLHDLGNAALAPGLLTQSSAYTPDERKAMQAHVALGLGELKTLIGEGRHIGALSVARDVVACHHECFDGSGYPSGLSGDAIPLAARIAAVADTYVAMTSPRPHRPAVDAVMACAEIKSQADKQFDARVVQAFIDVIDECLAE